MLVPAADVIAEPEAKNDIPLTMPLGSRRTSVSDAVATDTPVPVGMPLITGVDMVGVVPNMAEPVPVLVVNAANKLTEEGVAKNVATPVPNPETPVDIGRPVQLVSVPDEGVPRTGVVNTGLVIV